MTVTSIRFYEELVDDIRRGNKFQTIRYDWSDLPENGMIMNAVSTQVGDVFATLRIENVERMSVQECVKHDLDGHDNYDSVESLLSEMSEYYPSISEDDTLILIEFTVEEWLRD